MGFCSGAVLLCSFNKMYLNSHLACGPREKLFSPAKFLLILHPPQLASRGALSIPLQAPLTAHTALMDEMDLFAAAIFSLHTNLYMYHKVLISNLESSKNNGNKHAT